MPETISAFVEALKVAASSPEGLAAFALALLAMLLLGWRTVRHRQLLEHLEKLPERDRLQALRDEMGTAVIKGGLSPEQYLRSRIHTYVFVGLAILGILVVGLAISAMIIYRGRQIEGTVRFEETLQEVEGVTVGILGTNRTETTDKNGHFSFVDAPRGSNGLSLEYSAFVDTVSLDDSKTYLIPSLTTRKSPPRLIESLSWSLADSPGNCPASESKPRAKLYRMIAVVPTDPDSYSGLPAKGQGVTRLVMDIQPSKGDSVTRVHSENPLIDAMDRDPEKHAPGRQWIFEPNASGTPLQIELHICTASASETDSLDPAFPLARYWLEST